MEYRGLIIVGGEPRDSVVMNLERRLGIPVEWPANGDLKTASYAVRKMENDGYISVCILSLCKHAATEMIAEARRNGLPCASTRKYGLNSLCRVVEKITGGKLKARKKEVTVVQKPDPEPKICYICRRPIEGHVVKIKVRPDQEHQWACSHHPGVKAWKVGA